MRMACRITFVWMTVGFLSLSAALAQQPPHAPQVQAAMQSGDELVADLKFLTELGGAEGLKAWKPLKETLDTFFGGIDTSKPIIAEVLLTPNGSENRLHFPLLMPPGKAVGQAFLKNLKDFGIEQKRLAAGFYELKGAYIGFLRLMNGYGSIAEKRDSLPPNLANPLTTATQLLAKKYDIGLLIKNDKVDEASQKARRTDFQKSKDNLLAGLKVTAEETSEDFELRKELSIWGLEEVERFLADSAELLLGWNTDAPKVEGRLDLELTPIKGSDLDKSAEAFGKDPGLFASVPRSENAIISGRINFPLDDSRKTHAMKWFTLAKAAAGKSIDADKVRSADQKAAFKKASDMWFDTFVEGTQKAGLLNALIELTQVPGEKANLLLGIKSPNPERIKPILELVPKFKTGGQVKLDLEKVGELTIHQVTWPDEDGEFTELFGKGAPTFVATGPNVWWIAIGTKSQDQLKAAIAASGKIEGIDPSNFLNLFGKAGPIVDILNARRVRLDAKETPKKLTEAEAKNKRDRDAHRKLAIDIFKSGKDTWETNLTMKAGKTTGRTRVDEGLMRFVGAAIAKFSNDTLK